MSINSYAQNFEDVMLWRALQHVEHGFFIDIGAQDPLVDSVSLAFHERGWHGIHVEPTPHYAALLRQHRPEDTVIQAAAGNGPGILRFFEIPDTGISTADPQIAAQHRERGYSVHEIAVPCIPLAEIFQLCKEREIHWLKIDVEGFEKQVLTSWGRSQARPWIVVIESTLPMTAIETHESWEPLLLEYKYTPVYFDGLNRYYISEDHPELKSSFKTPPNIFDGFTLNGTASAPFHALIDRRHQEKLAEFQVRSEQQQRLADAEIARIKQASEAQENTYVEQVRQARREIESLLRTLAHREQKLAAQLAAVQQQSAQDMLEQVSRHNEQERALHHEMLLREHPLRQQLQIAQEQLQRLQQERVQREKEYAAQLRELHQEHAQALHLGQQELQRLEYVRAQREKEYAEEISLTRQELENHLRDLTQREQRHAAHLLSCEQRASQEKAELTQHFSEQEQILRKEYAQQVLDDQKEFRRLEQQRFQLEKEFSEKNLTLIQQHAERERALHQQLQSQQLELADFQKNIQTCLAIEKQLKAQLSAEQKAGADLLARLNETQRTLALAHQSLSWRMTSPFRRLGSLIFSTKEISGIDANFRPSEVPATISGGTPTSQSSNIHPSSIETIMFSSAIANNPDNQPIPATLDELLSQYDRQFINSAYRTLLGREPDPEGMHYYLSRLRKGVDKLRILSQLRNSPEGRGRVVELTGLNELIGNYRRKQLPLTGWIFRLFDAGGRYQSIEHKLRSIENQIYLFSTESNQRFKEINAALLATQQLVVQQAQNPGFSVNGAPRATDNADSAASVAHAASSAMDASLNLTPRAREIYLELQNISL